MAGSSFCNVEKQLTHITYTVPIESNVILSIFDMQGKMVTRLVNKNHRSGIHYLSWNAEGYPTGIYFAQLTSGSFSRTKKLMLIK